tara:strand:- start:205 stop:564 length:360 start_codon:yes stop_codon:yes gene_type:complete
VKEGLKKNDTDFPRCAIYGEVGKAKPYGKKSLADYLIYMILNSRLMQRRHYMIIGDIFKMMKDEILNPNKPIHLEKGLRFLNIEYDEFSSLVYAFAGQLEQRNERFNFFKFIEYTLGDE